DSDEVPLAALRLHNKVVDCKQSNNNIQYDIPVLMENEFYAVYYDQQLRLMSSKIKFLHNNASNHMQHRNYNLEPTKTSPKKDKDPEILTGSASKERDGGACGDGDTGNKVLTIDTDETSTRSNTPMSSQSHILEASTSTTSKLSSLSQRPRHSQPLISETFNAIKSYSGGEKSEQVTNAIIYMIAKDNIPLKSTDKEGFKFLMKTIAPLYKMPGRNSVTQLIDTKYEALSLLIKNRLRRVEDITLTTDLWTETLNTIGFLGVTAHFYFDSKLNSVTIGVYELSENHTGDYLGNCLRNICEEWNIPLQKITAVVRQWEQYSADKLKKAQEKDILKLVQSVPTRWNSVYYTLGQFLKLSAYIASILLENSKGPSMTDGMEIETTREVLQTLKPIEQVSKEICGEQYLTVLQVVILPVVSPLLYEWLTFGIVAPELSLDIEWDKNQGSESGVPRGTLQDRLHSRVPEGPRKMGPDSVLSKEEEITIANWCINLAKYDKRPNPFVNNRPGKKWYTSFLKRNPALSHRTPESISKGRTCGGASNILNDPERILNEDETNFILCPKTGRVLAPRGFKNIYKMAQAKEKEAITVLLFSASGKILPPCGVFPYIRPPKDVVNSMPESWFLGKSDTGWMKTDIFYDYITKGLDKWLDDQNIKRPVLVFVDGHKSFNYGLMQILL
ncbi:hypothetical protein NQ314_005962, partial [Rhamnusium bicolor]